ncbi:MAG: ABC transporter permease [Parachlamydiales bacterium]|nr:ABC transporter permease [Parachlamydiales bacterium]
MFKRIYSLIVKELLVVWQDKKSRIILIIPPLIQLFIFAFAATLDVTNASIAILNQDYGKLSYELTQRFQGSPFIKNVTYLDHVEQIKDVIDNQKVVMVVHIDQLFSKNLLENQSGSVQLILDGRKSNTAQIVQGYATKIIQQYNMDLAKKINLPTPSTILIPRNWFNSNLIYLWFTVPGLVAILTMVTALLITSLTIARERELGTFDQLLVSPLSSMDILIGKAVPGIIIGMAEGTIILLAAIFVFGVPFTGSIFSLYLSLFVFVCSIVGIGLFLSSLCNTQQQALLATFIFLTSAILLSGFGTPIETMPKFFQDITYINPVRYILVIVRGIFIKKLPFNIVWSNLYPIILIGVFNLSVASWFFRKRVG